MPKYFCKKCIKKLEAAHEFKQKCESTYNKFLKYLSSDVSASAISFNDYDIKTELLELTTVKDEPNCVSSLEINKFLQIKIDSEHNTIDSKFNSTSEDNNDPIYTQSKKKSRKNDSDRLVLSYQCYICSVNFRLKSRIEQHMKNIHQFEIQNNQISMHKCNLCNETFNHASNLSHHKKTKHLGIKRQYKSVPCNICGNIFSTNASQQRHIKIVHNGEKSFICPICDKKFGQLVGLNKHISCFHYNERNFKCDQCPKEYSTKDLLENHKISHLPDDLRELKTKKIRKHNDNNGQYQKLFNKKRFICEICGKSIRHSAMVAHIRMHKGITPYSCELCPSKFGTKQKLKLHSIIHSDERPFKCNHCDKRFRRRANMYEHNMVKHSDEKRYKCSHCDKQFSLPYNLRLHERIHTGEKPYKCNLCPEKYTNSGALRRHASVSHPGKEGDAVTVNPKQYVAAKWR